MKVINRELFTNEDKKLLGTLSVTLDMLRKKKYLIVTMNKELPLLESCQKGLNVLIENVKIKLGGKNE